MCETPRPEELPANGGPVSQDQSPAPEEAARAQSDVPSPGAEGVAASDVEAPVVCILAEVVPAQALPFPVPPADPPVACLGFWPAIGWCLLVLVVDLFAGVQMGIFGARTGCKPEFAVVALISGAVHLGVAIFALHAGYRGHVRRIAAVRLPAFAHGLMAVVLPVPLAVTVLACSEWLERWTAAFPGAPALGQRVAESWLTAAAPTTSRWAFLDEMYMELARQPWFILIVAGCLLPAVGEELFFRAFLGRGLIARFGVVVGVGLTSVLFGLFHLAPERILWTSVLGLVMHMVYLCSKSILTPMAVHFLNNLLVLSGSRWMQDRSWMPTEAAGATYMPCGLWAAAAAAVAALLWSAWRGRVRWTTPGGEWWTPGFVSAEVPHAGVARVARSPGVAAGIAAVGSVVCFAVLLAFTAWNWAALTLANRALVLSGDDEHDQAIAESDRASAMAPGIAWVRNCQGWVHSQAGDYERGVQHFDEALRLDPNLAAAYAGRASAHVQRRQYAAAIADASTAIRIDPDNAEAYAARTAGYLGLGEYAEAVRDADKAIALAPDQFSNYNNRGMSHQQLGRWDQALEDFAEAMRLAPDHPYSYSARAAAYLAREEYDLAVADATQAIQRGPDDADHYHTRGAALARKGDHDGAIRDFSRAMELQPGLADLYVERADARCAKKDYGKAIADYDKFLRLRSDDAEGYSRRASAHRAVGAADAARRDEQRSRELLVAQHIASASTSMESARPAAALDALNKALALDPRNVDAYESRAPAYAQLGNRRAAIADYDEAVRLAPDHANAYLERGRLFLADKQPEKALADCTQFIRLRPGDSAGYALRAQVYRDMGRTKDAEADEKSMLKRLTH
jgi:tetratricopeptide (TPR) repeat protein/membrane protease YdiL (CAAX protease family)